MSAKGEKSYRFLWLLITAVAIYSVIIAFMPWVGYDEADKLVERSTYVVIGVTIAGIVFLLFYMRRHMRSSAPVKVQGEQVLPHKLSLIGEPVGTGRKLEAKPEAQRYDRWQDHSCRQTFVKEICTTCVHYRRRYYGNFCKQLGMVVDKPTGLGRQAA